MMIYLMYVLQMSSTSLKKLLRPVSVDKSGGSLTWILFALVRRTPSLGEMAKKSVLNLLKNNLKKT
jgi:hypothetical protein